MDSREVARAALEIAMTPTRQDESNLKKQFLSKGIKSSAVDYGGEFSTSLQKVVERAVIAARREQVIDGSHQEEGAVAGAAREALVQVMPKALGLNVGGKVGIAHGGRSPYLKRILNQYLPQFSAMHLYDKLWS
jgi:hypothetical protein